MLRRSTSGYAMTLGTTKALDVIRPPDGRFSLRGAVYDNDTPFDPGWTSARPSAAQTPGDLSE